MTNFGSMQEPGDLLQLIEAIPHKPPFRFIDEILELDECHILGSYRYREDEFFYKGHFPEYSVTPCVILLETMIQIGGLVLGVFLSRLVTGINCIRVPTLTAVYDTEFFATVNPGEQVFVRGEKIYFRNHHLRIAASMTSGTGQEICRGIMTGIVGKVESSYQSGSDHDGTYSS